jgi:hypothetical protein
VDVQIRVGGVWSASSPSRFAPGDRAPGTNWIGDWVGSVTGQETGEEKLVNLTGTRTPNLWSSNPVASLNQIC